MIKIEMTHEDRHTNTKNRPAEDVERTMEFARQCGYVSFVCAIVSERNKSRKVVKHSNKVKE